MRPEWIRRRGLAILLAFCLLALCAGEAGARGPAINDIQPYDTIFVYEEGLDLTQLRNATTNNPITALQRYQDGNPDRTLLKSIPVADDTDFEVQDFLVNGEFGTYHAYSPQDGTMGFIFIREPQIFLDVVLASPHHNEPLAGLTVSRNTRIAFRVTSPDVGSFYQAGGVYPATVDIVLTTPGGAESTTISGVNLAGQNVSSTRFYTDDPGRPGPIELSGLREYGTYTARAVWRTPAAFDARAPDSEPVTFTVGTRVGVDTTPTPTVTPTPTQAPTTAPTTPPTTAATPTVTATPAPTATETAVPTTVPITSPPTTAAPLPVAAVIAALGCAVILAGRRR